MRKHLARRWKWFVAALAIPLGCIVAAVSADAVSDCPKPAAYGLYASSFMDSTLNPADAEDIEFLTRAGGVPNVMLMLDTSRAMNRLPGDGPASLAGAAAYPQGAFGCGLDATSVAEPAVQAVLSRKYSSPCGDAVSGFSTQGQSFNPSYDYADEAKVCPWFTTGTTTNAGGFDPDFYSGSAGDTLGNTLKPNFFDKDMVFHDTAASTVTLVTGGTSSIPVTDGWNWNGVFPHQNNATTTGNMKISTVTEFCQTLPEGMRASCNNCMSNKGFFFDGNKLSDEAGRVFPSIWYTGNYLNFFPPKFVIARKVMKDVLSVRREIRGALATLNASDGGTIVQQFNPPCDQPDPSSFFNNRSTYVNAINTMQFDDGAPFAEALLDIGQYYHSRSLDWFGTPFSGRTPWASGQAPGNTSNTFSICYPCQTSSVILFSGGLPQPLEDVNLPFGPVTASDVDPNGGKYAGDLTTGIITNPESGTGGIPESLCPECSVFSGADDYKNNLSRVAWYLHNLDLRRNTEATKDCGPKSGSNLTNGGKQTLDIYTIGFGTSTAPDGNAVLANAAQAGGGSFVAANDAAGLRTAVEFILRTINERSTSFSVATVSRLQTQTGQSVIVPRFDPVKGAFWKGHLFRYDLYSEFVNGCTPNGTGDKDCDGTCTGVFLIDSAGKFIQEDASGKFMRNEPDVPACNQSSCTGCGVAGNVPATPHWDAGEETTAQNWKTRKLYTAIDKGTDGRIDAVDGLIELADDATTAALLRPYMNVQGTQVCTLLANKLMTARDSLTAAAINADLTSGTPDYLICVQTMVRYLRGADVFNEGKLASPSWPKTNPTDLPDRPWKLGDIFHSSPVVIDPPLPSDGVLCARGLHNQCIPSLWATAVKHDVIEASPTDADAHANANAYDDYAKSEAYSDRRKVVLVGANDGFVHAFDAGSWTPDADDALTPGLDESLPPFNGYYDRGEGKELWAVMPPDQLAKVHLQLLSSSHQYAVDGTAMVRDVWVDGSVNGLGGSPAKDGMKQGREFHTVAVMSMRRGGTHYFALDVTDATKLPTETGFTAPKFLWLYPQPDTRDLLEFGETYSDFLPTPPPIGPVRIAAGGAEPAYEDVSPVYTTSSNASVSFHERWVVFLSGGFDPQYLRGRGVHMVDVWTGKEVFGFTKPLPGSTVAANDPRWNLNYPVAANVGMVMWGKNARLQSSFPPNEGYFDTATFGDVGGQLWVLRFNDPATLDTGGRATNWLGARAFQMDAGAGLCTNQPFFYITANVALANTGLYRVLAGTGDRFNLLDSGGGTCGPDNIRACVQRGCSVTLDRTLNHLSAKGMGDAQRGLSAAACTAAPTFDEAEGAVASCDVNGEVNVLIECPSGTTTTKSIQTTCTAAGDGYGCGSIVSSLGLPIEEGTSTQGNSFFSVTVFDTTGARTLFDTPEAARAYDAARLTAASLTQIDGASATPAVADQTGPGWAMSFAHSGTIPVGAVSYIANRLDERVSSPTAAANSCVFWNTTQRASTVASNDAAACLASKCTQEDRRLQHFYGADAATGGLCLNQPGGTGTQVRSIASATLVPPPAPQFTAFVNQQGQVSFGLTSINTETGAQNRGVGGIGDAASLLEWIEIDRDLHACRHAGGAPPAQCR